MTVTALELQYLIILLGAYVSVMLTSPKRRETDFIALAMLKSSLCIM